MISVFWMVAGIWIAGCVAQLIRLGIYWYRRVVVLRYRDLWPEAEKKNMDLLKRKSWFSFRMLRSIVFWWMWNQEKPGFFLGFTTFESQLFVNRLYFYLEGEQHRRSSPFVLGGIGCLVFVMAAAFSCLQGMDREKEWSRYYLKRDDATYSLVENGKIVQERVKKRDLSLPVVVEEGE
ncbi:hypothetical protein [uncultured Dubosiella sp.]|uniref:hypothetical protein n=1 Tax=uncultured Dubosiella sp. TaxID=1937011 RepID=UPI0025B3384E|nr:hypothetical protein [uncultured Dubosiella sp.]